MKQNIYDHDTFFNGYCDLRKNESGLNQVLEKPAMDSLLPDLQGIDVLDAGCGFGKQCLFFSKSEVNSVTGIDISEKMIGFAQENNSAKNITYFQTALEDAVFPAESFDLVVSSLAFHYVEPYDRLVNDIYNWLKPGGRLIFSVEHPIATAKPEQQWIIDEAGHKLYWPIDHYSIEGPRSTKWFVDNVIKYHRTIQTYVNTLIDQGFRLIRVLEPVPSDEFIIGRADLEQFLRRPAFLLISVQKG